MLATREGRHRRVEMATLRLPNANPLRNHRFSDRVHAVQRFLGAYVCTSLLVLLENYTYPKLASEKNGSQAPYPQVCSGSYTHGADKNFILSACVSVRSGNDPHPLRASGKKRPGPSL